MKILKDICVADFTRIVAGPYATRIFADFGARVIKVQSAGTATGAEDNTRGYFNAWNRNKQSITLNMARPEARDLALKLISVCDVVVENFSARVMKNWRLDYPHLKDIKEDIILLSLSGMGHTGPWQNYVAYGATVQALGGLTHLTAWDSERPVGSGFAYGDTISGTYGAIAVVAALEYRDRTGRGMHIDLSEYEAVCSMIGPELMGGGLDESLARPRGNAAVRRPAVPHGCYPCRGTDRWCVIAVFDEVQWAALVRTLGHPDWAEQERFATPASRMAHAEELDFQISQRTSAREAEQLVADLQEAGIPSGVVRDARDLADDPHLLARGFFQQTHHPVLGTLAADTSPVRFMHMKKPACQSAPLLGRDNRSVFVDLLGLTDDELAAYIEKGVIG